MLVQVSSSEGIWLRSLLKSIVKGVSSEKEGGSHLRWNSLEDWSLVLAPVPLCGVDFIPDTGERWLLIWSGCQGEEGRGEAGWTGEKGHMAGLVGDLWRQQKKREGGRGRGENMHMWNYKITELALDLVKKHCLQVLLRWFSGVHSQLILNFQYLMKFGKL